MPIVQNIDRRVTLARIYTVTYRGTGEPPLFGRAHDKGDTASTIDVIGVDEVDALRVAKFVLGQASLDYTDVKVRTKTEAWIYREG